MKLRFNPKQVQKAAKFILKRNKYIKDKYTVDQCVEKITNHIHEFYESDVKHNKKFDWKIVATMGYYLVFMLEDKGIIICECLVDPYLGVDHYETL